MRIAATTTAFPPYYFKQQEVVDELKTYWGKGPDKAAILERLHARTGVEGRYFSRPLGEYEALDTWGKTNNVWIETALQLGQQAIECLLKQSGLTRERVGALFFVSVTGVCSPSIDARLVNTMKLSPNIKRNPIFGLGCVAGAAGLARCADYVRAYPDQVAVLISVELCSLTWQRGDLSVANLISSGLFGDGSAAVIVCGDERQASGPRILATRSSFYRGTEDVMGWDISEVGFKIVLSTEVPNMVRKHLAHDIDAFLAEYDLSRDDISTWIMHTGGPKVLEATAEALRLPEGALDVSWRSLRRVGNLSSTSVLLVLEEFMNRRRPAPGSYSILAAMGPGFCAELVLLRW